MPVAAISPGTTRNPPPIPKNPDKAPTPTPYRSRYGKRLGAVDALNLTAALPSPLRFQYDHQHAEQEQQFLTVKCLAERGAEDGTRDAGAGKDNGTTPFDVMLARVSRKRRQRTERNCDGARAYCDMGRLDADKIHEQWNRKDRAAATY